MESASPVDDPIAHWLGRATNVAPRIGLPVDHVVEAAGIIRNAFGIEWIRREARALRMGTISPNLGHPVAQDLCVADEGAVAGIMELASCLRALRNVVGIDDVCASLRDAAMFPSALLQLSIGYRILVGGGGLELEPPVAGGRRCDISLKLDNLIALVEIYVPRARGPRDEAPELLRVSGNSLWKAAAAHRFNALISVHLEKPLSATSRRSVHLTIVSALRDSRPGEMTPIIGEGVHGEIVDITGLPEAAVSSLIDARRGQHGKETFGGRRFEVMDEDVAAVREGNYRGDRRGPVILLWAAPHEPADPFLAENALLKRIEGKLSQTRAAVGQLPRFLIVESSRGRRPSDVDRQFLSRLAGKLFAHRNVAGVLVCRRTWVDTSRFRYEGTWILGDDLHADFAQLIDRMTEVDSSMNPADTWLD